MTGMTGPASPMSHAGTIKNGAGVHVQMQTFTVADDHMSDYNSDDAQKTRLPDPEAGDAEISAEFKRPPY